MLFMPSPFGGSPAPGSPSVSLVPNNFGPTLLLILGLLTAPLLFGVPILLLGLAHVRSADGSLALPLLAAFLRRLKRRVGGMARESFH